jgi:hypothetical protein
MKQFTKTKVCYASTNEAGAKKQFITSEKAWEKLLSEADPKDANPDVLISTGTFGYNFAETVEEAVTLAGGTVATAGHYDNVDTFLDVFNYAASLRQDNEANGILQDENFEAFEGIKDVSYAVAQKVERAKMTPVERALKDLAKGGMQVTQEQLLAALALIQQQSAPATAGQ